MKLGRLQALVWDGAVAPLLAKIERGSRRALYIGDEYLQRHDIPMCGAYVDRGSGDEVAC